MSSTMTFTGLMFPKLCMTVYKCLHGLAPKFLAQLCVPVADVAGRVDYVLLAEDFLIFLASA